MAFLDKNGLSQLWTHILTKLNTKADTVTTTGSGNAITDISQNGNVITATKGSTFLTEHPVIEKSNDIVSLSNNIPMPSNIEMIDVINRDDNGHVVNIHTQHITFTTATTTDNGLMSKEDKAKIDEVPSNLQTILDGKASNNHTHSDYMTKSSPVGTGSFSMNRKSNTTVGLYSYAAGYNCEASGQSSHAIGQECAASADWAYASGYNCQAIGIESRAEGLNCVAIGRASRAAGAFATTVGDYAHANGYNTQAGQLQHAFGKYNNVKNAPTSTEAQDTTHADAIFMVGCGTSSAPKNGFRVSSGGKCYGAMAFGATGADFAELFEWADGNLNNEDRRGLFVTLEEEKIRLANADDDYIGVISSAQAFIGNSASEEWQGKYLTDVFGTKLSQEVEIPEEIDEETGKVIKEASISTQYILNPDYNSDEEYIMRENRKEWGVVGLLGQIVVIDDGTCVVGGYVKPSTNGVGTASDNGYKVMKRIDENHIKVLVR